MMQDKKLEFQKQLEEYLEEQKVYDIFEDMMKALIQNRPKDPLSYLVKKLTTNESKCETESLKSCRQALDHCGPTRQQEEGDCFVSR